MRSLLAKNISFKDGIQTVLSDLNQKQKSAERCKLLLALKTAAPDIKTQKQKIQKLTGDTTLQVSSYLPEQAIESTGSMDSSTSIEASSISTLTELPDDFDVGKIRDLFRKARKLTCSNTKCGVNGSGKFCQECGHRTVEIVNCTGEEIYEEEEMMDGVEKPTKILVRNLPSTVSAESLVMVFENTKRYGGGPVLHVDIDEDNQSAVVEFEEPEAVDTVLAKCPIQIFGETVDTEVYKPQLQPPKPQPNRTVKVEGVNKSSSRDTLLYFENRGQSGGGEIEAVESDDKDDVLYITFASSYDAVNVTRRRHTVMGSKLSVVLYKPQFYNNKILIKGLKPSTTEAVLFNFIEAKSRYTLETMVYHAKPQGVAMITFSENLVIERLIERRHMLSGRLLDVKRYHTFIGRPEG